MKACSVCHEQYEDGQISDSGACYRCNELERFAAFAKRCGLARFPDPSGERYVYRLDGRIDGKKSEHVDLIDELWNALVRARGGDEDLLVR